MNDSNLDYPLGPSRGEAPQDDRGMETLLNDSALAKLLEMPPASECELLVLLVDDQAIIAEAVRQALDDEPGISLHYCANGDEALRCAEDTQPTVILQDLVMPGIDGLTLVRQYRQSRLTRNIPVIVLSTKEDPLVKSAAFAAGVSDYLVKLPDRIELIARIRHHSRAYLNLLQRDEAFEALRQSQRQLLQINLELERLTHSDGLTGLSNRRFLDDNLAAEWRRAMRENYALGMLMIDVDSFKAYNDTYGHIAGDEVLKQVAAAIGASLGRSTSFAARFGGEEFAVVIPASSALGVRLVGEKIRMEIERLGIEHSGSAAGHVTVSIGAALMTPMPELPITALVESADMSLYEAKRSGKNQVVLAG